MSYVNIADIKLKQNRLKESEGMMMAILLMNVFAPTIDHYVIEGNVKRRKKKHHQLL